MQDSTATTEEAVMELPGFADLGLSVPVLEAVEDLGYESPTPVQAQAIPHVLDGDDLLAAAQTGTGKTAAFLLPAMSFLGRAKRHQGPFMLVLTPTRELAQQIENVCRAIEKRTGHRSVTVVGGVGYEPQKRALNRGCDILVATPGRLIDLIDQGFANLSQVSVLVLDEADRMLDMGFLPDMRKIVAETPDNRQTLLFSATLDERAIGNVRDLVRDPAIVEIARKGTVAETIDQYALPVSLDAKNDLLAKVLKAEGPQGTIVFCRTKHRADSCCRRLRRAGISCAPIHGDRSQAQRQRALASFRSGKTDVLVATDVLARGIDVSDVRYVINFDVPVDPEDYIHRIGRTGRAGEAGWALTFVTVDDRDDLFACEHLMGQVVPTYEPAKPLDCGEDAPELDPNRSADEAPRKKGKKRGGRKRAGGGRRGSRGARGSERTRKDKAEAKGTSDAAEGRADSDKPAKPAAKRGRRRSEAGDAILTDSEVRALMAGEGEGGSRKRGRKGNSRRASGSAGRGDTRSRSRKGSAGASDERRGNGAGKGRGHRRVGDQQGRARGVH